MIYPYTYIYAYIYIYIHIYIYIYESIYVCIYTKNYTPDSQDRVLAPRRYSQPISKLGDARKIMSPHRNVEKMFSYFSDHPEQEALPPGLNRYICIYVYMYICIYVYIDI